MLLSAITGLLVVMLVFVFAAFSKQALDSKQDADRMLSAVHIEQSINTAKNHVRVDWSAANSVFAVADGADSQIANVSAKNEIALLHSKTNRAFAIVVALSKNASGGTTSEFTKVLKAHARYDELSQGIAAALQHPTRAGSEKADSGLANGICQLHEGDQQTS